MSNSAITWTGRVLTGVFALFTVSATTPRSCCRRAFWVRA